MSNQININHSWITDPLIHAKIEKMYGSNDGECDSPCAMCKYPLEDVSRSYLIPVNPDTNEVDVKSTSVSYICGMCYKSIFVHNYNLNYDGDDRILYLPELSQAELNHIYNWIYSKSTNTGSLQKKEVYSEIMSQTSRMKNEGGVDLGNPGYFCYLYRNNLNIDKNDFTDLKFIPKL